MNFSSFVPVSKYPMSNIIAIRVQKTEIFIAEVGSASCIQPYL